MNDIGRDWCPLHVALAWIVTREAEFCIEIQANQSAAQRTFVASAEIEHAMLSAGCFDAREEVIELDPPTRTVTVVRHHLRRDYTGRFLALAEAYSTGGNATYSTTIANLPHDPLSASGNVSLGDFLLGRWHDAFRSLVSKIESGRVRAHGVAIDNLRRSPRSEVPPASAGPAMWLDVCGTIWEGPQVVDDDQPRRWTEVSIRWHELQLAYPVPVAVDLDDDARDPSQQTDWSFTMAAAWIAWRTLDDVRRHCGRYYKSAPHENDESGFWHLENDEISERDRGNAPSMSVNGARNLLWAALRSGKVSMTATPTVRDPSGRRSRPVERHEFSHLQLDQGNCNGLRGADVLCQNGAVQYRNLRVQAEAVQNHWPLEQAATASPPDPTEQPRKETPTNKKIREAIEAEKAATGKPLPTALRPGERNKRLWDRMKIMGLGQGELPGLRQMRSYFNEGAAKPAKNG